MDDENEEEAPALHHVLVFFVSFGFIGAESVTQLYNIV
jgi:hypothetical protein